MAALTLATTSRTPKTLFWKTAHRDLRPKRPRRILPKVPLPKPPLMCWWICLPKYWKGWVSALMNQSLLTPTFLVLKAPPWRSTSLPEGPHLLLHREVVEVVGRHQALTDRQIHRRVIGWLGSEGHHALPVLRTPLLGLSEGLKGMMGI